MFDHTLRTASDTQRETQKIRDIVSRVHNDYTEWSGPQRVRDIMGDEAEELLAGRFAMIQVWRPINHPVESHPLAICDAQTVKPEKLVINERRYPDRVGQTYAITYDPGQRWYWFPRMRPRRGAGLQGVRIAEGRPRPLDRPHRLRRTPPRRRTPGRAKASRSARWRFSEPTEQGAATERNSLRQGICSVRRLPLSDLSIPERDLRQFPGAENREAGGPGQRNLPRPSREL